MAKGLRLEECMHAVEENLETLRVTSVQGDELTSECASLTVGTEESKVERDILLAHSQKS